MKYYEIKTEQARLCCKRHMKKCEKCPLRVERTYENPYTHEKTKYLQFCRFVLADMEADEMEKQDVLDLEIQHQDEWRKFLESLESQE